MSTHSVSVQNRLVFTSSRAPIVIDGLAKAMSGLDAAQLATFISTNKLNVAQASLALLFIDKMNISVVGDCYVGMTKQFADSLYIFSCCE